MKLEAYTIDLKSIEHVGFPEFKRWLGRFAVMTHALQATKASWYEGWGEGGITAGYLANPQYPRSATYDEAIEREKLRMLELNSALPEKGCTPRLPTSATVDGVGHVAATESAEALKRVGVLDENLIPAAGALAVYALARADIYQAPDRFIVASMPRVNHQEIARPLHQAGIGTDAYWQCMYGDGTQLPVLENYQQWWLQLGQDLNKVDEVFGA